MKPLPSSVILFAPLLIAVVAGAVGWIARGIFALPTTARQSAAPPTAEISRPGSSSAASLTSQRSGGVSAEEPNAVAKRLLQAVLDRKWEKGSEAMLRFHFRKALAGCDEAVVAEMVEFIMRDAKEPATRDASGLALTFDFSELLMDQMTALNPRKALDFQVGLAQAGMDLGPTTSSLIMELLADQNAPDVQKVIEGLPPGDIRTSTQMAWWQARSKTDPEGVFQSLMNLDADARDSLSSYPGPLRELLYTLSLQSPEKALQAAALFPEARFSSIQSQLVSDWINRDPTAAVQWALEQNDAMSLMMCLGALPSDNRALVEKSIRDNFSSITSTEHAVRVSLAYDLAAHLAAQDIPEALRWVATLPAAEQTAANVPVVEAWMRKDAAAAAEWLTTWPAGKSRDEAVGRLVESIRKDDPEGALTWAASMQSPHRWTQMQLALGYLNAKDPAAAERALNTLSEEDRAVLSAIERHKMELK